MAYASHIRTARDTIYNPDGIRKLSFLRTTSQFIRQVLSLDSEEVESMKRELSVLENGRLHIHSKAGRGKYFFGAYSSETGIETGITDDMDRVHILARRAFLEMKIKQTEINMHRISRVLNSIESTCEEVKFEQKLRRYSESNLDLCKVIFTKEQNEWIDSPYSPNPFHTEDLKYSTAGNVPVRSKSESRLGSALESMGIPYRYDDIVNIGRSTGNTGPFRDSYFADFKLPNLCGGITIHEHLGAFNLRHYADNSLKRLNDYHNSEIYELPGKRVSHEEFTWSFENDVHNINCLHALIMRMLLPGKRY